MRIGLDIDGCLSDDDRNRLDEVSKYLYENDMPIMDMPENYEIKSSSLPWKSDAYVDFRSKCMWDYWENAKCFKYADEVTHKLHEEGHEIIIITGRSLAQNDDEIGRRLRKATDDFLARNNIYYDKLVYSTFPKIDFILAEKVDIMIEDFEVTIKDCCKYLPTLVFDNRYNRNVEGDNITRVYSWYDLYAKFKKGLVKGL